MKASDVAWLGITFLIFLGVCLGLVGIGKSDGVHVERTRWESIYGKFDANRPESGDWQLQDRFVMTIAVGMDRTAIITHVRLMDGDKRLRELELRGDTCMANSVKGLPKESGVWECLVEEWMTERFREFRVTESRKVI